MLVTLDERRGLAVRLLMLAVVFCFVIWFQRIDYQGQFAHTDLEAYRAMAHAAPGLSTTVTAPFAYRIFVPYVIGLLGPDDYDGFQVAALVSVGFLALQFYRLLKRHRSRTSVALGLSVLLVLQPYLSGFVLFDVFQAGDALSLALLLLMIEAFEERRPFLIALALIPAVATREISLFILPFILTSMIATREWQRGALALAACVPGIGFWLWLHWVIPISNPGYSTVALLRDYAPDLVQPIPWIRIVFNACTPYCLLFLAWPKDALRFIRSYPAYGVVALLFLGTAFVAGDKERMVAPMSMVMLLFVALVDDWRGVLNVSWFRTLVALTALVCSMHFLFARVGIPDKRVYYGLCIVCDLAVAVAALRLRSENYHQSSRDHESGDELVS